MSDQENGQGVAAPTQKVPPQSMDIGGVTVRRGDDGAVRWTSGLQIDADGSPRAYRIGGGGLDALGDAHSDPRDLNSPYCGVATHSDGSPVVQGDGDPAPGFLVSITALGDESKGAHDPRRYVDSAVVAYVSIPPELRAFGVRLGDVGRAWYKGRRCNVIVADSGPHRRIGEGSIALATALGIPSSPRNGGVDAGVSFAIWPGSASRPAWPRAADDIASQVARLAGDPAAGAAAAAKPAKGKAPKADQSPPAPAPAPIDPPQASEPPAAVEAPPAEEAAASMSFAEAPPADPQASEA